MEIGDGGANLQNQQTRFAYVVEETFDQGRSGVVVFKTGRTRQLDEPEGNGRKRVTLVRSQQQLDDGRRFDNGRCGEPKPFGERTVAAKDYDTFHDTGRSVGEQKTLNDFHFVYRARRDTCRLTAGNDQDSIAPWDPRSNRGQFSFDPAVVDGGTYYQALVLLRVSSAMASTQRLERPRVETRQYTTARGYPTCVLFDHRVEGRAAFLRVNDLESVGPSRGRFLRSAERRFWLSPQ